MSNVHRGGGIKSKGLFEGKTPKISAIKSRRKEEKSIIRYLKLNKERMEEVVWNECEFGGGSN